MCTCKCAGKTNIIIPYTIPSTKDKRENYHESCSTFVDEDFANIHFWCNVTAFEDSCGMATVDKCNGVINPDGSDMPRNPNLMEVGKEYKINDCLPII